MDIRQRHFDLTLVDAESGEEMGWSLTPSGLQAYRRQLSAFRESLETESRRRTAGLAQVRSEAPLRDLLLKQLTARGLLR